MDNIDKKFLMGFLMQIGQKFGMGVSHEEIKKMATKGLHYEDDDGIPSKVLVVKETDWDTINEVIDDSDMFEQHGGLYWNKSYGHRSTIEAYKLAKEKLKLRNK